MIVPLGKEVVLAKAAALGLYFEYAEKGVFNMDRFTSLERYLDNIFAMASGEVNHKKYPNPCSEILLTGTRPYD